ncbi:zf-HC2 domain-containing protein [Massilia sp. H6]|uniref:zf-HC2 domain-containing protein n=1 Tax=Massilia sp. H6 TaxID=2970464 RepID=UPI002167254A|nr:zf-HC2 domain-containing protein [Massilia sp. H6]UVW30058.1 zf-HC2 domain-containing protein [Massilia sp. H6]
MMSCKQMTGLISQSLDRELTTRERLSMRFHLMLCEGCTNYRDNLQFLHEACQGLTGDAGDSASSPD